MKIFFHWRRIPALIFFCLNFSCFYIQGQEIIPSWIQKGDFYEESQGRGLSIKSSPKGARVFIDGIERGVTPFRLENIRPGDYIVRLVKEGYSERRFRVSLHSGILLELSLELEEATGRVVVYVQAASGSPGPDVLPFDPRIDAEGTVSDSMNLILPVGQRTVRVRAFGWEEESVTVYVAEDSIQFLNFYLKPAGFRIGSVSLNRLHFNPLNTGSLGTTELNFEVSAPGTGTLVIHNSNGTTVFSRELGPFYSWVQSVRWDGRDSYGNVLPDGVYSLKLDVRSIPWDSSDPKTESVTLEVNIDSSRVIRPLTLSSAKSGLLFVPLPDLLPPQAFQFEGNFLFGNPPVSGSAWTSLPLAAAFRFSPLQFLEIAAALNVLPVFNRGAVPGIGGSVKWTIINPSRSAMLNDLYTGLALGAVISWAGNPGLTPFGMGGGIEINLPFSAEYRGFSAHLAPALLWTGDSGFIQEGIPRLLLSAGFMFKTGGFTSGISARSEYRFVPADNGFAIPSLLLGAEIKFFPIFSNMVFSGTAGFWYRDAAQGFFGGAGIGFIY